MTCGFSQSFKPSASCRGSALPPWYCASARDRSRSCSRACRRHGRVGPPAPHPHVCLVNAPACRARPAPLPAQALLDLRRVLLDPAENRRVVDRDAAFAHHLLEIAIAHPVTTVPAHRPEHDLALEVAPLEVRHGSTLLTETHPAKPRQGLQQSHCEYRITQCEHCACPSLTDWLLANFDTAGEFPLSNFPLTIDIQLDIEVLCS